MRNLIIGFGIGMVFLIGSICHLVITLETTKENEERAALEITIDHAMEGCLISNQYSIDSVDEFVSDFCTELLLRLNSNSSEIEVRLIGTDLDKGTATIEVSSRFEYPTGKEGEITCEKTVLLEEKTE